MEVLEVIDTLKKVDSALLLIVSAILYKTSHILINHHLQLKDLAKRVGDLEK